MAWCFYSVDDIADMKKLQFDIVNIDVKTHHYSAAISKGSSGGKEKVLRLAQEQGRYDDTIEV